MSPTKPPRSNENGPQFQKVRAMYIWDVKMPSVKKHMVGGHMIPKVSRLFRKPRARRVSVEIRTKVEGDADIAVKRVFLKDVRGYNFGFERLGTDEAVRLQIYRELNNGQDDDNTSTTSHDIFRDHPDDHSLSTLGFYEPEEHHPTDWELVYSYHMDDFAILKGVGKVLEISVGNGNEKIIRDVKFDTESELASFRSCCDRMAQLAWERTERLVDEYKKASPKSKSSPREGRIVSRTLPGGDEVTDPLLEDMDQINLLVEIVGAENLPIADIVSSDPYVIVRMGNKEIHRTEVIPKTLDPIWTLRTGSLFLLRATPEEFFGSGRGLAFIIKDSDTIGTNDVLGRVLVSQEELLEGNGDRIEYPIITEKATKQARQKGRLTLRFRHASEDDVAFMEVFEKNPGKLGVFANETYLALRNPETKFLKGQTKRGKMKDGKGMLHRVKPFPNPLEEERTKWMTDEEIETTASGPSTHWIESGSGNLGRLYVELIKADKLPNMDAATLNIRDKTDAFACMVFEDCIVNTDVITDSLSPRWMPWCRRAFVFNISHPSSDLLIGIFDHDPEASPLQTVARLASSGVHDSIGRLVVNVARFRQDTVYNLTYPLYYGETAERRQKASGSVTIRLRMEWYNANKSLLSGAMPPAPTFVSVARKLDFQCAHYTVEGEVDDREFSVNALLKYVEELESHLIIVDDVVDGLISTWLWRPHHKLVICGKNVRIPLHSMVAFTWGVLVTWNYNLFPAFVCFAVGWVMLTCNEVIRKNPSRWHQPPTFGTMLALLLFSKRTPEIIPPNENVDEIKAFHLQREEVLKRRKEQKKAQQKQDEEVAQQIAKEMEKAEAEADIASNKKRLINLDSANPLKPILFPVQKILRDVIAMVRIAKSVICWDEPVYAFWIIMASFAASLLVLFVPWAWILRWLLRVTIWIFLGPWMMLVDRYVFKQDADLSDQEKDQLLRSRLRAKAGELMEATAQFRISREESKKLKDMTRYCFGKYLLSVPRFREERFSDYPSPSSFSEPYDKATAPNVRIAERRFGQKLSGDMIPKREVKVFEESQSVLKPAKKRVWGRLLGKKAALSKMKATGSGETEPLLGKVFHKYTILPKSKNKEITLDV